jgi:hypothetical protein
MNSLDQAPLLRTDARIIAEDDTHAVVPVSINKKWIGRNLPFLAAIADLSVEPAAVVSVAGFVLSSSLCFLFENSLDQAPARTIVHLRTASILMIAAFFEITCSENQ